MGRIKTTKIVFHRVEGYVHECTPRTFTGPTAWHDVEHHVSHARLTAPRAGGYDKCDVSITFADGFEYRTRYDMQYPGAGGESSLAALVRREWLFYARRWRPGAVTKEQQSAFLAAMDVDAQAWGMRCDTYDVPGLGTPNARTLQWIPRLSGDEEIVP